MSSTAQPPNAERTPLRADGLELVTDPDGRVAELGLTAYVDSEADTPHTIVCSLPGGGYTRWYFDLDHAALAGVGQASFHAQRGWVFLSFDPLGSGESRVVDGPPADFHQSVRIHHIGMTQVLRKLSDGTLLPGIDAVRDARTIGLGHSLGGMQMIAQQGRHATFDALAVLAFSANHTVVPSSDGVIESHAVDSVATDESVAEAWGEALVHDSSHFAYAFFWEDVPAELVEADLGVGFPVRTSESLPPWVSASFPSCAPVGMSRGVVAREAAKIETPVFIAAAERDVIADLRAEPSYYTASGDITLFEVPRCGHMHNFSTQRFRLWERLHAWGESLRL